VATFGHLAAVDPAALGAMASWNLDQMMEMFGADDAVDLDRAWNVVFRLIDDLADPASMMAGATPVGGELTNGPAMSVDAMTVQAVSAALARTSGTTLIDSYEALDVGEIYTDIFDEEEVKVWTLRSMVEAARLFERAAKANKAIVFAIL
jgi:hypothetical protein